MKKAGIVIDDWKLKIFTETLEKEGYKYSQFKGPVKGYITLTVETDDMSKLHKVVKKMNTAAAVSKAN